MGFLVHVFNVWYKLKSALSIAYVTNHKFPLGTLHHTTVIQYPLTLYISLRQRKTPQKHSAAFKQIKPWFIQCGQGVATSRKQIKQK